MGLIDITNQKFGKLTVLKRTEKPAHIKTGREAYWLCQCDCGNQIVVRGVNLRNGNTKSCGCLQKEKTSQLRKKQLKGQRFGKLLVIEEAGRTNDGRVLWKCQCDCGKNIEVITSNLTGGKTTSCGCNRQKDITNQIFGDYKAIKRLNKIDNSGAYYWEIECIHCQDKREISIGRLKNELMICSCQKENNGSKYEKVIEDILNNNNINFIREKTFPTLKNPKTQRPLRCDFYINNTYIIEVDGSQHFKETTGNFKEKYSLNEIQYLDNIKNIWCKKNNIPIIRIPYYEIIKNNITIKDLLIETSKFLL